MSLPARRREPDSTLKAIDEIRICRDLRGGAEPGPAIGQRAPRPRQTVRVRTLARSRTPFVFGLHAVCLAVQFVHVCVSGMRRALVRHVLFPPPPCVLPPRLCVLGDWLPCARLRFGCLRLRRLSHGLGSLSTSDP